MVKATTRRTSRLTSSSVSPKKQRLKKPTSPRHRGRSSQGNKKTTTPPTPENGKKPSSEVSPGTNTQDAMSVDSNSTNAADNTSDVVITPYVSFLSLQIGVDKSSKGSEEMRNKIIALFKILRLADETIAFSTYKTDAIADSTTKLFSTPSSAAIEDPKDVPTSITAMGKYFHGARPNNKGGTIWTQVRLLHSEEIDNIIADTKEDFSEKKGRLTLQRIQHWDVATLGFLKNVHPDVDVHQLTSYFSKELNLLHPQSSLELGLEVKSPFDGK